MIWLPIFLTIIMWPGDVDGSGEVNLLDYRAYQVLHGRPVSRECLYRTDNETLALRPAVAHIYDYTGRDLTKIQVVDGCFDRPIGFGVYITGEDMTCRLFTNRWICTYKWYVDDDPGNEKKAGALIGGSVFGDLTVNIYCGPEGIVDNHWRVCTAGPTQVAIDRADKFTWTAAGIEFESESAVCIDVEYQEE